jgi:hypothetical protein
MRAFVKLSRQRPTLVQGASESVKEFFASDIGLLEDALKRLGKQGPVIRDGDMATAFGHANMTTLLASDFESQPPQRFDHLWPGDVARQFHAVSSTASLTK